MKKKALFLAAALAMLVSTALPALAVEQPEGYYIEDTELVWYHGKQPEVTIPQGITLLRKGAFSGQTQVTDVTIPDSVTTIGNFAFEKCVNLVRVSIPDGVTEIGWNAFYGCESLDNVVIPDSVTSIGRVTFRDCKSLRHVTLPSSLTEIKEQMFFRCSSLTSLPISSNVTVIGQSAFQECTGLTGIDIPDGVTIIGKYAFGACKNVTRAVIPVSVTKIEEGAFRDCSSLKDVYYAGTEEQWNTAISIGLFNLELENATFHFNAKAPTTPETPSETVIAVPTNDKLTCNGVSQNPTIYKINGGNYFKIRDLAAILNGTEKQFSVGYDSTRNAVTISNKRGTGYTKLDTDLAGPPAGGEKVAVRSHDTIYMNGVEIEVEAYKIDGSNYFKLRDLGLRLNFYVSWEQGKGVFIETDKSYEV